MAVLVFSKLNKTFFWILWSKKKIFQDKENFFFFWGDLTGISAKKKQHWLHGVQGSGRGGKEAR